MRTLLLSAPKDKNTATGLHKSFSTILSNRIGPEYAIYGTLLGQISPGMKVIVFERVARRQAEGTVATIVHTGNKTGQGVRRYNISIPDLHEVQYSRPPQVNRCGVGIVP